MADDADPPSRDVEHVPVDGAATFSSFFGPIATPRLLILANGDFVALTPQDHEEPEIPIGSAHPEALDRNAKED
jgi:hypothetical protein